MLDAAQRSDIERGLVVALEKPNFSGAGLWLTFYLVGAPAALNEASAALEKRGCVNLDGWEGGFLYPKQPCAADARRIIEQIDDIRSLCQSRSIEILHVDLDTSSDVARSAFQTLIEFAH